MTNNAARSRRARREILREVNAAYRDSRDATRENWPKVDDALQKVQRSAEELAGIAGVYERLEWSAMAEALEAGDVVVAGERLAEVGYEPAAEKLIRLWECECGGTFHCRDHLVEHIDSFEWWLGTGHGVSTIRAGGQSAAKTSAADTPQPPVR